VSSTDNANQSFAKNGEPIFLIILLLAKCNYSVCSAWPWPSALSWPAGSPVGGHNLLTGLEFSNLATLKIGFRQPSLLDLHRYTVADLALDPQRPRHSFATLAAKGRTVRELSAFSLSFPYHFCFVTNATPVTVLSVLLTFPSRDDILCSELVLTHARDGPQSCIRP